jgi:hypothetical protein
MRKLPSGSPSPTASVPVRIAPEVQDRLLEPRGVRVPATGPNRDLLVVRLVPHDDGTYDLTFKFTR